ncbi:MAG: ATP phosphoribosyltransferase regulatory subunit [Pseudomonadota bacterium]
MSAAGQIRARADAIARAFIAAGAEQITLDLLQPAGALLDLYGEDIRARAYTTHDPDLGEMMLRPDFTMGVALRHIASGAAEARYTYTGEVFRVPPPGSDRQRAYLQTGYELFGLADRAAADAEVFALFSAELAGAGLQPVTGDMGILIAAVDSLSTTERRRRALRRHLWRPRRFRTLFDRFAGRAAPTVARAQMVQAVESQGIEAMVASAGPAYGLRSEQSVRTRLARLAEDAHAPPIPTAEAAVLDAILALRESMDNAHAALSDMSVDLPGISDAVARMGQRMAALSAAGVDPGHLAFEASYGRTNMEYYDGFVFGFVAPGRPDLPPVATGGRYDALTGLLGQGGALAAVGGVIRPEMIVELGARS